LSVEAKNAREDIGLRLKDASVVDEVPARKVIRRVNNHIVLSDYFHSVARVKPDRVRDNSDLGIDEAKFLFGGIDFSPSQVLFREKELPLKVRHLNQIRVSDPDPAYSSGREIDGGRNSKAPKTHYQHRGALESPLPLRSYLWEDEVSAVTLRLTSS
jgi:hypothetical protein